DYQLRKLGVEVQVCGPVQQLLQGHYTMQVCQVAVHLVGHTQVDASHATTVGVNSEAYDTLVKQTDAAGLVRHRGPLGWQSQLVPGGLARQRARVTGDANWIRPDHHVDLEVIAAGHVPRVDARHCREIDSTSVVRGALWVIHSVQPQPVALGALDDHCRCGAGMVRQRVVHTCTRRFNLLGVVTHDWSLAPDTSRTSRADTVCSRTGPSVQVRLDLLVAVLLGQDGRLWVDGQTATDLVTSRLQHLDLAGQGRHIDVGTGGDVQLRLRLQETDRDLLHLELAALAIADHVPGVGATHPDGVDVGGSR